MTHLFLYISISALTLPFISCTTLLSDPLSSYKVVVSLFLKDNEATLPFFLSLFSKLTYPKEKMSLFIVTSPSEDRTMEILDSWLDKFQDKYNVVRKMPNEIYAVKNTKGILHLGRVEGHDYVWFVDPGLFFIDFNLLQRLIEKEKNVVAPMLHFNSKFSNFWYEMTDDFKFKESSRYNSILDRKDIGCHSAALLTRGYLININMNGTESLTLKATSLPDNYESKTDVKALAYSAKRNQINIFICNDKPFGFLLPKEKKNTSMKKTLKQMHDIKNQIHASTNFLNVLPIFNKFMPNPEPQNVDIDKVYIINLVRRPMKKRIMLEKLKEFGFEPHFIEAVDGETLNASFMKRTFVLPLEDYDEQSMTYGAVGSFLSHHSVWEDVIKNKFEKVLILEDEAELSFGFRKKFGKLLEKLSSKKFNWDLITLYNKFKRKDEEEKQKKFEQEEDESLLLRLEGPVSTVGYLLTQQGAKKLVTPSPLGQMLPLDQYIPIKYGVERRPDWKHNLCPCDLQAFSIHPKMVRPIHSSKGNNKIADTINSPQIDNELFGPRVTEAEYIIPFCEE